MKAVVYSQYGLPHVLEIKEVEKPTPKSNEVLVKNFASSVNSFDWDLVRGKPAIYRLMFGLFKPQNTIIGIDVAGTVVAVGENVTRLKVGDAVFGDASPCGFGAFAQYVCVSENLLALKPEGISFEEAGSLPHSAVLALQSLNSVPDFKPGLKILINGAGGCVGPIVIQLAKQKGAEITAVDSTDKFEMLQKLGADFLIDYKTEDFTKSGKRYDVIIDLLAQRSVFTYNRCLNSKGVLSVVGGKPWRLIEIALVGMLLSKLNGKKLGLLVHRPNVADLDYLASKVADGSLKPIIDNTYPLENVAEAIQKIGDGNLLGKALIKIDHESI
jgi:NADPH:quinone reductase-like Zn-dependent oxidoreductase